jgi:hypothetical protein
MLAVYLFVFTVGLIGVALYLLLMFREVPGAAEERFGKLEDLPQDIGKWVVDEDSPEAGSAKKQGLLREVRYFHDTEHNRFSGGRLLKQVRYRNAETRKIERVEPDEVFKRKRRKVE